MFDRIDVDCLVHATMHAQVCLLVFLRAGCGQRQLFNRMLDDGGQAAAAAQRCRLAGEQAQDVRGHEV